MVVAVSQEDKELTSFARFLNHFGASGPWFEIVADLNRDHTKQYDRTTTYLIDKQGKVRQIFPMLIHYRASWDAVLHEMDRILGEETNH